jgi:hypothetical protein
VSPIAKWMTAFTVLLGLAPASAQALPLAKAEIQQQDEYIDFTSGMVSGSVYDSGPVNVSLISVKAGDTYSTIYGSYTDVTTMSVNIGDPNILANIGSIVGDAQAQVHAIQAPLGAGSTGLLRAYFGFVQKSPPPFVPTTIPVNFSVSAAGSISGSGAYGGTVEFSVTASQVNSSIDLINYAYSGTANEVSIKKNVSANLSPEGAANYQILMSAYVSATAGSYSGAGDGEAQSAVNVDPTITFDQAAFDQMYGASAYNLADYYGLEFSPNLHSAPEPSFAWLTLSGLGALRFAQHRRRRE